MKKPNYYFLLICTILVFGSTGCALKEYYAACKADQACVERAEGIEKNTKVLVTTGVAMVPHPAAQVAAKPAGDVVGKGVGLIAMLILGRALTKKKETKPAVQP